jgi:hypothetical protein
MTRHARRTPWRRPQIPSPSSRPTPPRRTSSERRRERASSRSRKAVAWLPRSPAATARPQPSRWGTEPRAHPLLAVGVQSGRRVGLSRTSTGTHPSDNASIPGQHDDTSLRRSRRRRAVVAVADNLLARSADGLGGCR